MMNTTMYGQIQEYIGNINEDDMSPEKVKELLVDYQKTKSQEALNGIIQSMFKLIFREANRFSKNFKSDIRHFDKYDLIQEGILGIIQAANNYTFDKEVKFSTYGYYYIISYMDRFIDINKYDMTIPVHVIPTVEKVATRMKNGEYITAEDIHKEYGNNMAVSNAILSSACGLHSIFLDATYNNSNEEKKKTPAMDYINPDSSNFVDDIAEKDYKEFIIKKAMRHLTEKEKDVIINYYGLFGNKPKTFRALATERGYSRQLANIMQKRALRKMRYYLEIAGEIKEGGM